MDNINNNEGKVLTNKVGKVEEKKKYILSHAEIEKIREFFEKLKSVKLDFAENEEQYDVYIKCVRYRGIENCVSGAQVDYIKRLAGYKSSSNLYKLNKFAASKIIDFCLKNEKKYSVYVYA